MKWMLFLILFAQTVLVEAQTQLTAKVGYELAYKEFEGLVIYDTDNSSGYTFIENLGLAKLKTIQLGGRFGMEKAYEGGIGIAFGTMGFQSNVSSGYAPQPSVFRTSVYVERFYDSERAFWFGTGAQLYSYKMKMERTFEDQYPESLNGQGVATLRSRGMEWRLMARLFIGENMNHSITGAFGLSGEVIVPLEFSLNSKSKTIISGGEFVFGIPVALYYSWSF